MKALVCELCGSNGLTKEGGFYVCEACGTKYTLEDARKLLVEVDDSKRLENLYKLARRANIESNAQNAANYYGQILELHPDDWEANFYHAYYDAAQTTVANISASAQALSLAIPTSCALLINHSASEEEILKGVEEMVTHCNSIAKSLFDASMSAYRDFAKISSEVGTEHLPELAARLSAALAVCMSMGDSIDKQMLSSNNGSATTSITNSHILATHAVRSWRYGLELSTGVPNKIRTTAQIFRSDTWIRRIHKYSDENLDDLVNDYIINGVAVSRMEYRSLVALVSAGKKQEAQMKLTKLTGASALAAKNYVEKELTEASNELSKGEQTRIINEHKEELEQVEKDRVKGTVGCLVMIIFLIWILLARK